jgi:diaminopimelate epimerase
MLRLTKYHALGNDFLILLDLGATQDLDAAGARALCDRHRGVGADGIIHVTRGTDGADLTMHLRNADGSTAETSGNGLACLTRAAVDAGVVVGPVVVVTTDAGLRRIDVTDTVTRVEMATAKPLARTLPSGNARKVAGVDLGNPHVVVLVHDVDDEDFARTATDANWEAIVEGPEPHAITMRVWERGVGETQACGTGACAAAFAANEWGVVGDRVVVHQPGGDALVELGDPIVYAVQPQFIASIEVP